MSNDNNSGPHGYIALPRRVGLKAAGALAAVAVPVVLHAIYVQNLWHQVAHDVRTVRRAMVCQLTNEGDCIKHLLDPPPPPPRPFGMRGGDADD